MATKDPTFVKFTPQQAADYAKNRGHSYPLPLYQAILDYHKGARDVVLDVGTGPGKVLFDLAHSFDFKTMIGTDTSAGMLDQARKGAEAAGLSSRATFLLGPGETTDETLFAAGLGPVDVITVAMAAHWIQLPAFYAAAAKVLKPGGTLAMWTCTSLYAHPSTRNREQVQAALSELEDGILKPYYNAGTMITRAEYRTLDLPWTIDPVVPEFKESDFVRVDWDKGGVPSAPPMEDGAPGPFLERTVVTLGDLERGLGSASTVIRYREAHPEVVGSPEDPVTMTIQKMRDALGGEELELRPSVHLLLMRKAEA